MSIQYAAAAANVTVVACAAWLYSRALAPIECVFVGVACVAYCMFARHETLVCVLSIVLARLVGTSLAPVSAAPSIAFSCMCCFWENTDVKVRDDQVNPVALRNLIIFTLKAFQGHFLKTALGDESARTALALWDVEFSKLNGDLESASSSTGPNAAGRIGATRLVFAALGVASALVVELASSSPAPCAAAILACCAASMIESVTYKYSCVSVGSIAFIVLNLRLF
jgi:hypothetical protein